MFREREKLYQAYRALLSMALSLAFTLVINQYFQLRGPIFLCGFFSFLVILVYSLISINRNNTITYLVLLSIIPILALVFWIKKFNPILWLKGYADWILAYDGSEELYQTVYAYLTIFLVVCLSAILFFLLIRKQQLKVLLAVVIFALMIISSIYTYETNKTVVGICVFYIMTIVVECFGILYARRTGIQEKKESILYLAPICLLLAVVAVSFPAKQEPIQWKTAKLIYHTIKEKVENSITDLEYYFNNQSTEFYVRLTGYSDQSGELTNKTGKLVKSDKVAMNFNSSNRLRSLYLIGSVSDIYTGHSWEKSHFGYLPEQEDYLLDYTELAFALARIDPDTLEKNKFIERETFQVQFKDIKTKTFFYPLKTREYEFDKKKSELLTQEAGISFKKPKGRGVAYHTVYYDMNLQGEEFIKMLQASDEFNYDNPPDLNTDLLKNTSVLMRDNREALENPEQYYPLLKERAALIHSTYTDVPATIPQRVKNLTAELTGGYDNNYDKLKAIEKYLQSFSYTLSPKTTPEGQDFIDYFLFESKEGYCTSFATAMAIMGRCIGVPTRYVEGFVTKFENQNDNNMFPIKNSQAHAWAEAYFVGVGWIPFEATAKYKDVRYTKWAEPAQAAQPVSEVPINPYEEMMKQNAAANTGQLLLNKANGKDKLNEITFNVFLSAAAVVILVLLFLIYYLILSYRYRKTFKNADTSKKMYMMFIRILTMLKREGFELQEQETILMLARRVKDLFDNKRIPFLNLTNIFMRYRYAQEDITENELQQFLDYEQGLMLKQRAEKSRFILWIREYAFLLKNRNI